MSASDWCRECGEPINEPHRSSCDLGIAQDEIATIAAERDALRKTLSWIAYCDTEDHEHFEPHLYRSMMIELARVALENPR